MSPDCVRARTDPVGHYTVGQGRPSLRTAQWPSAVCAGGACQSERQRPLHFRAGVAGLGVILVETSPRRRPGPSPSKESLARTGSRPPPG